MRAAGRHKREEQQGHFNHDKDAEGVSRLVSPHLAVSYIKASVMLLDLLWVGGGKEGGDSNEISSMTKATCDYLFRK